MSTETATKQQFRIKERKSDKNEQAEYAISQLTPVTDKLNGFDFWRTTLRGARLVVAPMVDQSELAWRLLSRRHKAELCYTPMYHASVFIRDGNYRRESLQSCDEDRPLIVQFCANKPETFLQAAKMAEDHCDAVDLNLGCPQSIARRGHYGAFLQDEWDLLHKMVSVCHKYLKVPITCKIRCFDEVDKTVRFAKMLENAGCQLLTIHGRTKEQKGIHTGLADWSQIKAVKDNLTIPVFANGNIQYYEDIQRCIDATGVEGVMSAEGNLHNPALFDTTQPQVWEVAEEYLDIVEKYPCPMSYIRGHLFKLFHHVLQVYMELRKPLSQAKKLEEFRQTVAELKEACQADVKRYKEDPASFSFNLPFPYWVCQPYERPKPDDTQQKEKKERKRPLEVNSGDQSLSINKMKKLVRNPNKKFLPKEEKFEKCKQCGNPKGLKCLFHFCKGCCRALTRKEILDCPGHKIWYKTAKQKWLSKQTAQVANTSTEVVSTSINKAADSDSPVRDSPTSALNDEQTDTGRINATSDHG